MHADRFEPLPPERAEVWSKFGKWDETFFPNVVGIVVEEIKLDYARLRLPYRAELNQPAGVVHGGAIATMIDTVVVPAILSGYEEPRPLLTVNMLVQYLGAVRQTDAIAEGWVVKRGRRTVFCHAEVTNDAGDVCATGELVYSVRPPDPQGA